MEMTGTLLIIEMTDLIPVDEDLALIGYIKIPPLNEIVKKFERPSF